MCNGSTLKNKTHTWDSKVRVGVEGTASIEGMGEISLLNTMCLKGGGLTCVGVDCLKFTPFGENACTPEDPPGTGDLPGIRYTTMFPSHINLTFNNFKILSSV